MAGGHDVLLCRLLGQVSWHLKSIFKNYLSYEWRSLGVES